MQSSRPSSDLTSGQEGSAKSTVPNIFTYLISGTMSTYKPFLTLSLLFIILLSYPSVTRAGFDARDLDGHYTLKAGEASTCARDFEVEDDDITVEADDIELDDRGCGGGSLALRRYPSSAGLPTNTAVRYFANKAGIDNFLAGPATNTITCGPKNIPARTFAIFIEPDSDVRTSWNDIYGPDSELSKQASFQTFTLDDDTEYLFLGDFCFYEERGGSVCFPANATVTLPGGIRKRMDQVQTGDRVLVADGTYSDVFGWTHRTSAKSANKYVQIITESGHEFVATRGHYLYADGKAMPAGKIRVGMKVRAVGAGEVSVVKVDLVKRQGLYNPQTMHGDIVVDGLVSTTYTKTIEPAIAHSLLAPLRAAWHVVGRWIVGETQSEL